MSGLCVAVFALIYLRMMWLIQQTTGQTTEIAVHARALEASHRQRDALEADLRHLAFHDELTGLANRALLHDRVEHALASAPRSGRSVALCFGDLDGFKTVNDTLGHHVGDSVLIRASRLLASIVRPGDTVARLGGDEFAVLMVDVERPETVVDFAHRIVTVLRNAPDFEGNQVGLSISVGIAYAEAGKSTEQLLSEADSAMYEAKEKGKNRVEVFQKSMRSRMLERLDLTNGFRWALGRSEFFLQYQPIVSLSDNRLHGFEALVRWSHPSLGVVAPLRFIPIAEETGFIVPLGRWVLVEACEQLASWNREADEELNLSVNLSRRQLMSPHLADEVQTALSLSGIDPHRLILEITESVLMDDPDRAQQALSATPGHRHPDRRGRFRHGILVAQPPPAIPGGHPQDRQVVHRPAGHHRPRKLRPGDGHHRAGPEPRAGGHRRGHRAREPTSPLGRPRVRQGAGVPDGPTARPGRGPHPHR